MNAPPEDDVIVFRGSRRACLEFGLVLDAKSIAYQLIETESDWVLAVPAALQSAAREELTRYAAERRRPRRYPPAMVPFSGAPIGVALYVLVLLFIAHAAGAGWFGIDWLAAGDLHRDAAPALPWWRALTALTLHLDALHLIGNLLFGAAIGVILGRMFGPGVAWAAILGAGMLANLVELWLAPADHRAAGASTAVFAALGLLSGYGWGQRRRLTERWLHTYAPLIAGACLLALFGAGPEPSSVPGNEQPTEQVDVLGHLLGFGSGVLFGFVFAHLGWPRSRRIGVQAWAGCGALAALLAAWMRALWAALNLS